MRLISNFPLMALALILYNLHVFGLFGGNDLAGTVFSMGMVSGATWSLDLGELLILVGLVLLFFEILKSTRVGSASILDHLLSTLIFVVFLVEFLLVGSAATGVFFILMVMSLIDVLAGFAVSVRSATRDVAFSGDRY